VWTDDGIPDGTGKATATVTFTADDEARTTLRLHVVADFTKTCARRRNGLGQPTRQLAQLLTAA